MILALMVLSVWAAQAEYIMTEEEMMAIYQESFDRMNTTGHYAVMTLEDLPAWEAEYTRNTGRERKDDLIMESLPMEGDMPYEEAKAYAKQLIMDKFGTPEAELDAMGVYPRLMDYVYMENESDWEFYFTPRRDTDIDLDHRYDGEGEYRVTFGAQSGRVEYCNWYIADLFPFYAQRAWDAGKHDYIFQCAKRTDFYEQPPEDQQHFLQLFEEAGYDTETLKPTDEELFDRMHLNLLFADLNSDLFDSEDPQVKAVLAAVEKEYGLSPELLRKYGFSISRLPLQRATADYAVHYNYNRESALYAAGELDDFTGGLFGYASRLGMFMVSLDSETGEAVKVTRLAEKLVPGRQMDESLLLGRREWNAEDLRQFDEAFEQMKAVMQAALPATWQELEGVADSFMRSIGGDPDLYTGNREADMPVSAEEAEAIAFAASCERVGRSAEDFQAYYEPGTANFDGENRYYVHYAPRNWRTNEAEESITAVVDATTGEVKEISLTNGFG